MAFFAVQYGYVDRPDALTEVRPAHREFIAELFAAGSLLASGPYVSGPGNDWPGEYGPGALLLLRAESAEAVVRLLDADPFYVKGLIEDRQVRRWTQVRGPFEDDAPA